MAWAYQDYESQSSDAMRLARLRQHIGEVNAQIQPNLGFGSERRDNQVLKEYLADVLEPRRRELERIAEGVRFTRARPL